MSLYNLLMFTINLVNCVFAASKEQNNLNLFEIKERTLHLDLYYYYLLHLQNKIEINWGKTDWRMTLWTKIFYRELKLKMRHKRELNYRNYNIKWFQWKLVTFQLMCNINTEFSSKNLSITFYIRQDNNNFIIDSILNVIRYFLFSKFFFSHNFYVQMNFSALL